MPVPTSAQLITFLVELEDDPARRHALDTGWSVFEAARDAGLVGPHDISGLAVVVHDLVVQDLLRYRSRSAGAVELPPTVAWNDARLQEHHQFFTTERGRADAERYRRWQRERADEERTRERADIDSRASLTRWFEDLHFVFELPPGHAFPPFGQRFGADDADRLRRYTHSVQELADSTVLTQPGFGYRVHFTPDGIQQVEASMPAREQLRGVAALFRQIYADRERASFAKVSGLLRRATDAQLDAQSPLRREMLDAWRTAQGRLRGRWLEGLLIQRGQELGRIPPAVSQPNAHITPEEVLKTYFYGEHLHWDRGAEELERWRADPFADAHYGLLFIRALGQLSALYIGFGALAMTAAPFDFAFHSEPTAARSTQS